MTPERIAELQALKLAYEGEGYVFAARLIDELLAVAEREAKLRESIEAVIASIDMTTHKGQVINALRAALGQKGGE